MRVVPAWSRSGGYRQRRRAALGAVRAAALRVARALPASRVPLTATATPGPLLHGVDPSGKPIYFGRGSSPPT
ncbi:MAG: hypothetical protein ABJC62_06295 [Frankiaceae bacterium]